MAALSSAADVRACMDAGCGGIAAVARQLSSRNDRDLFASMRVVFAPVHLKRTLLIAFVIGTWLNLFNHGDEFAHGVMNAALLGKLVLNYLTPFVVSNAGLLARTRHGS